VPEGDTIAWTANRIRPVLAGHVPDEIIAPRSPDWPRRLTERTIAAVDTYGKHLFIRFEGGLLIHSHLGMVGSWAIRRELRGGRRLWLAMRVGDGWVLELDGPTLELITEGRQRFDQRLSQLGPDVLAERFDSERFLARLRSDDQTRPLGDALLDQRNVAGIGNIWKAEGCWEAGIDPWRPVSSVSNDDALSVIDSVRPRMLSSGRHGPRSIRPRIYRLTGRPCPRCGAPIKARGQGDHNRTTYWCPGCQR
jgi:endonuclease VIII